MGRQDTRPNLAISLYRIIYAAASVIAYATVPYAEHFFRRIAQGMHDFNGLLPKNENLNKKPVFWVHAVSMGESLGQTAISASCFSRMLRLFTTTH